MADASTQSPPSGGDTPPPAGDGPSVADLQKQLQQVTGERDHWRGVASKQPPAEKPKGDTPPEQPPARASSFDQAVETTGLSAKQLAARYRQDGALSEGEYRLLEKQGYGRSDVNRLIQSDIAVHDRAWSEAAKEIPGGETKLKALIDQIDAFVPEARRAQIRTMLADPETMATAATLLKHHHDAALGADGFKPIIEGSGASASPGGPQPFATHAEMAKATRDYERANPGKRAEDDPAFFARIEATHKQYPGLVFPR